MKDHDQRMKVLLQEFFPELIRLRFPDWEKRFDFSAVQWLPQEIFVNPPQGENGAIDLVARLPARVPEEAGGEADKVVLVHTEIEAEDKAAPLRRRMHEYYTVLRRKGFDVFPLAVYMHVGLEGIGWDEYEEYAWGKRVLHFSYPYLGLPALDAETFVGQDNWLAVALTALMRAPNKRRVELGREAWRRLVQCPESEVRRHLLCECLDAYLPLDEEQRRDYESAVKNDPDPKVRTMTTSFSEKGRLEGREEVQREWLRKQLEAKFGPLPPQLEARLAQLPSDRLDPLFEALLKGASLSELGLDS